MNKDTNNIDYSIIIPVYFNEGSLVLTFQSLKEKVINTNKDKSCEVIFIDDGSGDNSLNELFLLKKEYPKIIKIIKFTRNFGQLSAILAGYKLAKGNCLIHISADLQDPPELINEFLKYTDEEKYDIVIADRESRDEGFYRKITSKFFYWLMRKLAIKNMPLGGFDFFLISSKIKDIILSRNEANTFLQGQILWTGYKTKFIPYERRKREQGKSRWTFARKIKMLIDGVMAYSYFPIRVMSIIGSITALIGFIYAIVVFFARIFGNVPFKGYAPLV
ncbi:MAG: glycosyltransferase family 2 protein, partial [Bacteroidales bacterium]|nr:glycosyltransferase family 2 protein [Bacteroidales bacterium]